MPETDQIIERLWAAGSKANVEGMARFGIRPAKAYGVTAPVIRGLAKELGNDNKLARELWKTGVLEARALATMIADASIEEAVIERWVRDLDCWGICDALCICLVWKTPFAWRKVREWSSRKPEYERRAAFALLAGLAVHDKQATDKQFRATFGIIAKAATDDRNFVKKAVNWSLRQIGKRNPVLCGEAMAVAENLIATESRSARWIGHDALRELRLKSAKGRVVSRRRTGKNSAASRGARGPVLREFLKKASLK